MKKLALLALGIVTIIWGIGFILVDIGLQEISPIEFMFFRFLTATLAIAIILNKRILTILSNEIKYGIILGIILYISFYLQTEGLKFTTASKNAFLTSTYVVFVPIILYIFEKVKISYVKMVCVILAIIGSGIMVFNNNLRPNIGDLLTLSCAVFFAMHIYLTYVYIKRCRASLLVFVQMATMTVLSFLFALPQGLTIEMQPITAIMVVLSGVFATAVCYFLQTWAQQYVSETSSALILSMESVVGMIAAVIILDEKLTVKMVIGAIIILISVICCELKFEKKE